MEAVEETVITTKGAELHAVSYFHPRPLAMAVVVHSIRDQCGEYACLVKTLWNARFSVYLYNWRHQTDNRRGCLRSWKEAVDDFSAVLEHAKLRETGLKTFVVAREEGEAVCLCHCAKWATLVSGAVLFTPSIMDVQRSGCSPWATPTSSLYASNCAVLPRRLRRVALKLAMATEKRLRFFEVPVVLLYGKDEASERKQSTIKVLEHVSSTDATLLEIEGRTDYVWSNERVQSAASIVEWMLDRCAK